MKELEEMKAGQGNPKGAEDRQVEAQATTDLKSMLWGHDLTHMSFTSHRPVLGPLVVLAKKGLSRLLTPILERQSAYNAANARVIDRLKDEFSGMWAMHVQWLSTTGQLGGKGAQPHTHEALVPVSPWLDDELPTQPDDPKLDQWYHTIDLGNGLTSKGIFDHRPVIHCYGLPESLEGKTCLDVGTGDGFFAFEMERRGAARVVGIDLARAEDFDAVPQFKARLVLPDEGSHRFKFMQARAMRRSRVEFKICNVYDLSPETLGMFDVVFCGSMLLHLHNPLKALSNIRAVTREMAIIETLVNEELEASFPDKPYLSFGIRPVELLLGEHCVYWGFTTKALEDMLAYAGFAETQPQKPFRLPGPNYATTAVVAYTTPRGGVYC